MSLLPLSPVSSLVAAGSAAGMAGGAAVGTFARLLGAAFDGGRAPANGTAENRTANSGGSLAAGAPAESPQGRAAELSALRQQASALRAEFLARFRELMREHGIDAGAAVRLAVDEFGDLRVVGDHPQAADIEHALATATELTGLFHDLTAVTRTLAAAENGATGRGADAGPAPMFAGWPLGGGTGPGRGLVLTITPDSCESTFARV